MREIKFRIYDKSAEKFCYSGSTPMMLASFFKATAVFNTRDEQEYYQFTGLLDKAGKEIYEGDYLQHYGKNPCPSGVVEHFDGGFVANWNGGSHFERLYQNLVRHYEVIGNIHDNPELLEKK